VQSLQYTHNIKIWSQAAKHNLARRGLDAHYLMYFMSPIVVSILLEISLNVLDAVLGHFTFLLFVFL